MSPGITWCFDDQSDVEAALLMDSKRIHHLPVLNRKKRIVGVLTMGDLALRSAKKLGKTVAQLAARDAQRHAGGSALAH